MSNENLSIPQILQLFGNKDPVEAWQERWAEQEKKENTVVRNQRGTYIETHDF